MAKRRSFTIKMEDNEKNVSGFLIHNLEKNTFQKTVILELSQKRYKFDWLSKKDEYISLHCGITFLKVFQPKYLIRVELFGACLGTEEIENGTKFPYKSTGKKSNIFKFTFIDKTNVHLSCTSRAIIPDFLKSMGEDSFKDVTLDCKGGSLRAHKFILTARSKVFQKMFLDSTDDFGPKRVPTDYDVELMTKFLEFLYANKVDETKARDLLVLADNYDVPALKSECEQVLLYDLTTENALSTLFFADKHLCLDLKRVVLEYISCHSRMIAEVHEMGTMPETSHIGKSTLTLMQEIMRALSSNS